MLKWYRNRIMLNETLEQNKNELQKYKNDKIVALLKDESNLIKDHLILLEENEKLKKAVTMLYLVAKLYDMEVYDNLDEKDKNLLNEVLG